MPRDGTTVPGSGQPATELAPAHTHRVAHMDLGHVSWCRCTGKGTFCSCGNFTNRLVFLMLEKVTWSQATLTTRSPNNHTHPLIHPRNKMLMAQDRGKSVGAGGWGIRALTENLFWKCFEKMPVNTFLAIRRKEVGEKRLSDVNCKSYSGAVPNAFIKAVIEDPLWQHFVRHLWIVFQEPFSPRTGHGAPFQSC